MEDPNRSLLSRNDDPSSNTVMNMKKISYICGWCGKENEFNARDELSCIGCGYRIFYKKRLQGGANYEAR
jgi:DNA-directed RNA polymerase I, II, and III subunit RPABC4